MDSKGKTLLFRIPCNLQDDLRRLKIAREVIGPERKLLIDANQRWEVGQAVAWMRAIRESGVRPCIGPDLDGNICQTETLAFYGRNR